MGDLQYLGPAWRTLRQHVKIGEMVYVQGRVEFGAYLNKDGEPIPDTVCHVDAFEFLGSAQTKEFDEEYAPHSITPQPRGGLRPAPSFYGWVTMF